MLFSLHREFCHQIDNRVQVDCALSLTEKSLFGGISYKGINKLMSTAGISHVFDLSILVTLIYTYVLQFLFHILDTLQNNTNGIYRNTCPPLYASGFRTPYHSTSIHNHQWLSMSYYKRGLWFQMNPFSDRVRKSLEMPLNILSRIWCVA